MLRDISKCFSVRFMVVFKLLEKASHRTKKVEFLQSFLGNNIGRDLIFAR